MNVSLTPELEKFVSAKVESGRYNSASEVVREALRRCGYRRIMLRRWRRFLLEDGQVVASWIYERGCTGRGLGVRTNRKGWR
jgi:putative addiction module CopG family antidote